MHHAPAVSFPLGRSRFLAGLLLTLWLGGVAVMALWCYQQPWGWWRMALGVLVPLLSGLLSLNWWLAQASGVLQWDGKQWQFIAEGAARTGCISVQLDLQQHLLLRLSLNEPPLQRWLWLEQASDPALWRDLRRAAHANTGRSAPVTASNP